MFAVLGSIKGRHVEVKKGRLILLLATGLISIGLWDSSGVVLAANKPQAGDIHLGGADGSSYRKLINSGW